MPVEQLIAGGIGAVAGLAQTLIESGKAKKANKELDSLFKKRRAYKTPAEVFDILNLTTSNAAQGYSDETMNYLTGQAGAGLSAGLGAATRLGADPNQLSGLLDSYYQDIFKIGNENELVKMKKFDSLTNAMQLVAQNKDAEWQSQENLIKDQMQSVAARLGKAEQGINSGLNFGIQGLANIASANLYGDQGSSNGGGNVSSSRQSGSVVSSGGTGGRTPSEILAQRNQIF